MSCAPKKRVVKPKKIVFHGNRWTQKKQRNGDASVPTSTSSVLFTEEIEVAEMNTDQELGNCCQSATPTISEVKLQNMCKVMKDFSEEGSSGVSICPQRNAQRNAQSSTKNSQ